MPRPKVIERRRCLKACDHCKKRKEKCDGLSPCNVCKKRNREEACTFFAPSVYRGGPTSQKISSFRPESMPMQQPVQPVAQQPNASKEINPAEGSTEINPTSPNSAPVPRLSRLLRDGKGGLIYIGDSASLSFLQTIRRMVDASIGPCTFTSDELRHLLIENTPSDNSLPNTEPILAQSEVLELTKQFFLATSGALDLFDPCPTMEHLGLWAQDSSRKDWQESPIFYLLLAIGAQSRALGPLDEHVAHYYFTLGHQQAKSHLLDDLSVLTVQAHLLITWYLITACRRNRAAVELGIGTVQAAFALGIHRREANALFGKAETASREKSWKTLRVCDLFLSASMGRPSITSNVDRNIPPVSFNPSKDGDVTFDDRMSSSMVRICYVFERILSEVYPKRALSLELAASISKQHKEWTMALPEMLKIDGLSQTEHHTAADLTPFLGSAVVVMAYYYSIILLTRPFLTFKVNCHIKTKKGWRDDTGQSPDVTTYADACVDSAIKGIEMAHDVLQYDGMPNRLPLLINSVFISALNLGLAYFGDYDSGGWALGHSLNQAISVLRYFEVSNPQSFRYKQIIEHLWSACSEYKCQRDGNKSQSRSQLVRTVFGNASAQVEGQRPAFVQSRPFLGSDRRSSISTSVAIDDQNPMDEIDLPPMNDFDALLQSSMITMSGGLTPMNHDGNNYQYSETDGLVPTFFSGTSPVASRTFSFGNEAPLFSVMNDFQVQSNWQHLSTRHNL